MEVLKSRTVVDVFWTEKHLSESAERYSQSLGDLPVIQMVPELQNKQSRGDNCECWMQT